MANPLYFMSRDLLYIIICDILFTRIYLINGMSHQTYFMIINQEYNICVGC